MDRTTFETALTRDGFEVVSITMQPDAVNATHVHPFDARLLLVDGTVFIDREGTPRETYHTGDTWEITNGTRHSETAGAAGATYVAGRRLPAKQ